MGVPGQDLIADGRPQGAWELNDIDNGAQRQGRLQAVRAEQQKDHQRSVTFLHHVAALFSLQLPLPALTKGLDALPASH